MTSSLSQRPVARRTPRLAHVDQGVLVTGLVAVLAVALSIGVAGFATAGNLVNIVIASAGLGILALGQALVVVARGLDLSVVAIYGVSGQLVAVLLAAGWGEIPALVLGLVAALLMGALNGLLVAYVDIPAIFVTLATSLLFLGAFRLFVFAGSVTFSFPSSATLIATLGHGRIGGVPVSAVLWLTLAAVLWWLLSRTVPGRMVYARGDNPAAAALAGMPARPLTTSTYVGSAFLAFVAGVVITGAAGNFDTRIISSGSQLYDLLAIVVIGGVSLAGGRGNVLGVVAATFFIAVLLNGMTLLNFDEIQQSVCKALIVLAALVLDRWMHPPNEETARAGEL